jgi:4-hydroxybenzoate polyprenyltransferase
MATPVGAVPDVALLATFGVGSVLLRGAGCTVNDLWDRDIDSQVARTRNRPIASGAISVPKAVVFLGAQLGLGLMVLLQLNDYSKILGASSLALVGAYPAMKRITNWPQAFLGLTFNWGALLGWAAVHGSCDWGAVLPLYASGVAWTLVYDTIYAHQDKSDDVKVGVKSTALHFGDDTKKYLSAFAVAGTSALCASGAYVGLDWPFYAGVATAASHLAWQIATVDLNDRDDCAAKFKSNSTYGALVFASIVAGKGFL